MRKILPLLLLPSLLLADGGLSGGGSSGSGVATNLNFSSGVEFIDVSGSGTTTLGIVTNGQTQLVLTNLSFANSAGTVTVVSGIYTATLSTNYLIQLNALYYAASNWVNSTFLPISGTVTNYVQGANITLGRTNDTLVISGGAGGGVGATTNNTFTGSLILANTNTFFVVIDPTNGLWNVSVSTNGNLITARRP